MSESKLYISTQEFENEVWDISSEDILLYIVDNTVLTKSDKIVCEYLDKLNTYFNTELKIVIVNRTIIGHFLDDVDTTYILIRDKLAVKHWNYTNDGIIDKDKPLLNFFHMYHNYKLEQGLKEDLDLTKKDIESYFLHALLVLGSIMISVAAIVTYIKK